MTTLQEKRHREVSNSIAHTVALRDESVTRLVRYEHRLKLLRKRLARLERTRVAPPKPAPVLPAPAKAAPPPPAPALPAGDDPIPAFLDRRKAIEAGDAKDAEARERIERDNAEREKAKASVRIAKLKIKQETKRAKLAGELRQMPLTGRAALEKIRAG